MVNETISNKERLDILFAPAEYAEKGGNKFFYGAKQSLDAVGKVTDIPSPYASVVRKITEAVGPSLAYLGECRAEWSAAAKNFVCAVEAIDLLEIVNDANYFINGGFVRDRAKKRYYSVAAHIALVPANIITVLFYAKNTFHLSFKTLRTFAATIGNLRFFGFAPKVAQRVQNWPGFRSIPNLVGKAHWLGDVRVFGFVTKVSLATVARVAITAAHIYFAADAWHRRLKYHEKCERDAAELFKQKSIAIKQHENRLTGLFERISMEKLADKAIGHRLVKYAHNRMKAKQARLDLYASGSEIALKVAAFGGLAAGATVAGSVSFAVLGAFSFVCVGRSLYHRLTTSKPNLEAIIKNPIKEKES